MSNEPFNSLIAMIESDQTFDYDALTALLYNDQPIDSDPFVKLAYVLSEHQQIMSPRQMKRAAQKIANLALDVLNFNLCESECADDDMSAAASSVFISCADTHVCADPFITLDAFRATRREATQTEIDDLGYEPCEQTYLYTVDSVRDHFAYVRKTDRGFDCDLAGFYSTLELAEVGLHAFLSAEYA